MNACIINISVSLHYDRLNYTDTNTVNCTTATEYTAWVRNFGALGNQIAKTDGSYMDKIAVLHSVLVVLAVCRFTWLVEIMYKIPVYNVKTFRCWPNFDWRASSSRVYHPVHYTLTI